MAKKPKKVVVSSGGNVKYIHKLTDQECIFMMSELKFLNKNIESDVYDLMSQLNIDVQSALEYTVNDSIVLWAKVYLNWEARDYQIPILNEMRYSRSIVLRLGRRLGKTDMMCIAILWYSFTQNNKGPNNQYDILVLTPYETQIDIIFDRLGQLIQGSPLISGMVDREIFHRKDFINGTVIKGLTAGANSGNGAASTRGVRADLIIYDEVDKLILFTINSVKQGKSYLFRIILC